MKQLFITMRKKFKIGKNLFVGYSPERNDPGIKDIFINKIPKLVSGHSNKCLEITRNDLQNIF